MCIITCYKKKLENLFYYFFDANNEITGSTKYCYLHPYDSWTLKKVHNGSPIGWTQQFSL